MMGGGYPPQMGGMNPMMGGGMGMGMRPAGMTDYNHNGVPDRQEGGVIGLMGKFLPDRNGDGIPDILQNRRY